MKTRIEVECVLVCSAAAKWWVAQLRKSKEKNANLDAQLLEKFQRALCEEMRRKYKGHWYKDKPRRGSAYRSISFDHRMDPLLQRAAATCGMRDLPYLLKAARHRIVFVNPGEDFIAGPGGWFGYMALSRSHHTKITLLTVSCLFVSYRRSQGQEFVSGGRSWHCHADLGEANSADSEGYYLGCSASSSERFKERWCHHAAAGRQDSGG